ncbi:unnamed protein product [Mytilus edulis]|uniref:Uncharacterized protein n=1 Tax=Mytilus edulis TaxID=6550 RepID=A0A8S3S0S3_MYTED|nr:unnamed protein product [Mytilus edulis]
MNSRGKLQYDSPPSTAVSSVSIASGDMEISKQRRRHEAIMKARKRNMVAKSLLQDKIHRIHQNQKLQFKQLTKEKRLLEEELDKTEAKNTAVSYLPSIFPGSSLASTVSTASINTVEPCSSCMFGTTKTMRCQNFPCCLPHTYHTIGGQNLTRSYSKLSNYRELQRRSSDIRPPTSHRRRIHTTENNEDIRSPRKSVDDKIRGLNYLIRELREEHEKNKPINWSTNYGEPFPKRLLLRPSIPLSL